MSRPSRPFEAKYHLRIIVLTSLVAALFIGAALRAFQFQIVEGEKHLTTVSRNRKTTITIPAARGEIVDRNGIPFTENKAVFNIEFDYSFMKSATENDIIYKLIRLLEKSNEDWIDTLPITKTSPYEFLPNSDKDVERLKNKITVNSYTTASDCMENMRTLFKLKKAESDGLCTHCGENFDECTYVEYTEDYQRKIIGVRYQMVMSNYSVNNRHVFAEDVSAQTVALIKEFSDDYVGTFIVERSMRTYVGGDVASHLIGSIGPIYAEELAYYQGDEFTSNKYLRTDYVGKSGIEKASEQDLRGKNGKVEVVFDENGVVVDTLQTVAPVAGKTVQLSLDFEFQKELQQILADYILSFNEGPESLVRVDGVPTRKHADSAGLVVLDVKTGSPLAIVSYPYYNILDYSTRYSELAADPAQPLFNNALQGYYRPGSTYKPVVAAAALQEGLVTPTSTITCTQTYQFWPDYQPGCLGIGGHWHKDLNVSTALNLSCNIYFYDAGRRLGIDVLNDYARLFGFGVDTGLEISNLKGRLSSPERAAASNIRWEQGDVIQTAIGQASTDVTPLQMAVEAMVIANKGVRYNTHIVKALLAHDTGEVVVDKEPVVASSFDMTDEAFSAISAGMIAAGRELGSPYQLTDFGYEVAIKTGTPQVNTKKTNNDFVAFAPVDSPEIAIALMVEDGYNTNKLLRKILIAYERTKGNIIEPPVAENPVASDSTGTSSIVPDTAITE